MYKQYLYKLYLLTLALPLVTALIIIGWKRETLDGNAKICGLAPGLGFRLRIYLAMATDLLRFLHGHYGSPITVRPRDAAKMERLRSGPSLLVTAHFHNWELMGAWLTHQGIPLLSAARPMAQGFSHSLLMRLRNRNRMQVLFTDIPRRALRHIQGGGCFGLIWDQRAPVSRVRSPLFGRTLGMDPLPRFLIRHASVPVYFGVLLPGGRFRLFQIAAPREGTPDSRKPPPSLRLTFGAQANRAEANPEQSRDSEWEILPEESFKVGRRYHRILECLVRAHPTSWYGLTHRRFLQSPG